MSSTATSRALGREQNRQTLTEQTSQFEASELSTQQQIQQLAYALWEQRGCPVGSSEQDWMEAEQQVSAS